MISYQCCKWVKALQIFYMEEQNDQSYKSRWSSSERFPSLYSPQKLSRRSSLTRRVSLIDAMDLQIPEKKEGRQSLMNMYTENRTSRHQRFSNASRKSYEYKADIEDKDINRSSNFKITHQCSCQQDQKCNTVHCSCFLTPRQICVVGQCCPQCIQLKNNFLMNTRGWTVHRQKIPQQPIIDKTILDKIKEKNIKNIHYFKQLYGNEPNIKNLIYCTCKKSHCQKKYCLCYQKGIKCGQLCDCINCENRDKEEDDDFEEQRRWQRYAIYKPYQQNEQVDMDYDIDQYMEQQMFQGQFNQQMQFQPPNFSGMTAETG